MALTGLKTISVALSPANFVHRMNLDGEVSIRANGAVVERGCMSFL